MGFNPSLLASQGMQTGSAIAQSVGKAFGTQDAGVAGQRAGLYGVGGTGASAVGDLLEGVGGAQQAAYQQQIARNNVALINQSARDAESAGGYAVTQQDISTGKLVASQKAAQAANGIDTNSGSAVQVRGATQAMGDQDAAMLHYNAIRQAFGLKIQAGSEAAMADMYGKESELSLLGGAFKAGSTLLSGASSLGQKWSAYKQAGVGA